MIEIHSRIRCKKCDNLFWSVYVNSAALSKSIKRDEKCPFCGEINSYEYEFDAVFDCLPKRWQFWKKDPHYIENHFSKNELELKTKTFPRKCVCGKTVILYQRRLK